ncbi:MAG: hypothetical protein OEV00_16470, partial [Acidobacteriota bacterium]|nr:hypothetical protein [Acidobacteriota bacterium]
LAGSLNYGWQELRSLRDGRYKLIDSDRPELFDLANDPGERDDLASLEPGRVQEMQARLAEFLESMEGDVASAEQTPIGLTAAERALLASLGYTEGSGGSAENATHPQDVVFLAEDLVAGAEMLKAGNYEQGKELAEYVLGLDPANKWALQHLSNAFASEGKFQEAQDVAKEFMDRYPDADQSYINFGHILKARGDDASTLAHFRNARERFPDSEWIAYYELLAGFDNDLPEVCEAMIRKAIDDFPTFSPITVMLARCSARNGDPDQAVSLLRIAVANGYASMSLVEASADFADTLRSEAWRSWREEVDGKLNALQ